MDKISEKYDVFTRGTLDLRFLAEKCESRPLGLEWLSREHLGIQLDKGFSVNHYLWEIEELPSSLRSYAAKDAFVSIELFKYFLNRLKPRGLRVPLTCFDVLGLDCIDKRYIYRSELDIPIVRPQSLYNGQRTVETVERSEGISGWGLALAGAAALGGFLFYRYRSQHD